MRPLNPKNGTLGLRFGAFDQAASARPLNPKRGRAVDPKNRTGKPLRPQNGPRPLDPKIMKPLDPKAPTAAERWARVAPGEVSVSVPVGTRAKAQVRPFGGGISLAVTLPPAWHFDISSDGSSVLILEREPALDPEKE